MAAVLFVALTLENFNIVKAYLTHLTNTKNMKQSYISIRQTFLTIIALLVWTGPAIAQIDTDSFNTQEKEIIEAFESGELLNPSHEEKALVGRYLDGNGDSEVIALTFQLMNGPVLYEGFDAGELPENWANVDSAGLGELWQFNNPGNRNFDGFEGNFAILDSDNYGGGGSTQDAYLESPLIDVSGLQNVSVTFLEHFRSGFGGVPSMEISTDQGETWQEVFTHAANVGSTTSPYVPVQSEYDITSFINDASEIQLRWRFQASFSWWWAIDEIQVYEPSPEPTAVALNTPEDQSTEINLTPTLMWSTGPGASPDEFDVYFGTDPNPDLVGTVTETEWTTPDLDYSTTYYWNIVAKNEEGSSGPSATWSFTTLDDPAITAPFIVDFSDFPPAGWEQPYGELTVSTEFSDVSSMDWEGTDFLNSEENSAGTKINLWVGASDNPIHRWFTTPEIDMGDGSTEFELRFDIGVTEYRDTVPEQLAENDYFAVVVSFDGGETWSSDDVLFEKSGANGDQIAAGGETIYVPLDGITGDIKLGFYAERVSGSSPDLDLHLGNMRVREAIDEAVLVLDINELEFDELFFNESQTKSFSMTNDGGSTMNVEIASDNPLFSVDGPATFSVEVGETAEVKVVFSPLENSGDHTGVLTISAEETIGTPATIDLSGSAIAPPVAEVNPQSLDISASKGDENVSEVLTITNKGTADLGFSLGISYGEHIETAGSEEMSISYEKHGEVKLLSNEAVKGTMVSGSSSLPDGTVSFEESEGFSLGFIDEQQGWSTFSSNVVQPSVSTDRASDGSRSLKMAKEPNLEEGEDVGAFSPMLSLNDQIISISVDVYIEDTSGADYDLMVQAPSQGESGLLTSRVKFRFLGQIMVVDTNPETGEVELVNTGVDWLVGEWATLEQTLNLFDDTITYSYNGEVIHVGSFFSGTAVEELLFVHDNWNQGETAYFDNIQIEAERGWLSADATSGVLAEGESIDITLHFDTEADADEYLATLSVITNNPDAGTIHIPVTYNLEESVSIGKPEAPVSFTLDQNYPNPFNPTTNIRFGLPEAADVTLEVYNMLGQRVDVLVNENRSSGYHNITFDGSNLSSGVYIYRIQAGNYVETRKLTLIK